MKYEKKSKWWNCISDLTIMGQEPPSAAGHLLSHVLHTTYSGELETHLCSITLNVKDKCRNFYIRKFDVFWIPFCWHRHWYHFEDNCDKWPSKNTFRDRIDFWKVPLLFLVACCLDILFVPSDGLLRYHISCDAPVYCRWCFTLNRLYPTEILIFNARMPLLNYDIKLI